MKRIASLAALVLALSSANGLAQAPAFPGAIGHGSGATGGRGGTVYRVTTLANSGAGSFRDAVSQPNRIIIFDVGGYITLSSEVAVSRNITIAGQTAPGGGIAIRGAEVSLGTATNIIIRHVRFRPGSSADSGAHCVNIRGTNVMLDQVSLEFGPWNNVGGVGANLLTIMRSLIADPIGQQFGAHMERLGASCTWYQNIFANGHNRQPLSKINTVFINNVVYNYEAAYTCGDTSGNFSHDIIGNYFITGPATDTAANDFYQIGGNQSLYESGNFRDSNRDGVLNGSATSSGEGTALGAPWSPLTPTIPAVSAATAFRRNLSLAGAWPRDQVDNIILNEVRSIGTSGPNPLPSSQAVTGLGNSGFGTIPGGVAPLDTDRDGMPDYWEVSTGSNPNSSDAMIIGPNGYARIENYLNWLAEPHALTTTNKAVDADLRPLSVGFTNASPVYSVTSLSNGVVALVSGHFARFTPSHGFTGLGAFRFTVTSSDGLKFTNTVVVLASVGGNVFRTPLIPAGGTWRYFDETNDPGNAWRSNSFNDASWSSGPARLGYGNDGEVTAIASNRQWTTYFRRQFYVSTPSNVISLTASLTRDDAAVIYLNGAQVWRDTNFPSGAITNQTPALTALGDADETSWFPLNLQSSARNFLVPGWNLIAAEVHNQSLTSSDLGFDFELIGAVKIDPLPTLSIAHAPGGLTLLAPTDAAYFTLLSTPSLTPPVTWSPLTNPPVLTSNEWRVTLPPGTNGQRFFRLQSQ